MGKSITCLVIAAAIATSTTATHGKVNRETTPASEKAAELGLEWLAKNQGKEGNWDTQDLGLVAVGALAFLSAGNTPETGKYRENVRRALDYVLANAKPSGMLNITGNRRDMYNHGLATFVLTQAYGMSNDKRLGRTLRRAVKLIIDVQCKDGGWDYVGARQAKGHDLSLAVMQAKALRGSMDIGIHIPEDTINLAVKSVQGYYRSKRGKADNLAAKYGWREEEARYPGRFTYNGGNGTTAMAAAGAVCMQEFGRYEDFRIRRSINGVLDDIDKRMTTEAGRVPFDGYTMYYVAQALYQVGGEPWAKGYPKIRDAIVKTQAPRGQTGTTGDIGGSWAGRRVGGKSGHMFATAVAVFTLNIPNRFLPILQRGDTSKGRKKILRARANTVSEPDRLARKSGSGSDKVETAADSGGGAVGENKGSAVRLAVKTDAGARGQGHSKKRKALAE